VKCFYAEWDKESLEQKLIIEELREEFERGIEFKMMDVEIYRDVTSKSRVHALPTILIEKNGEIVKKFVGKVSKDIIVRAIRKYME